MENVVTEIWIVKYNQDLTACDTFNEDTFEGSTNVTHQEYGFINEEDALKFYKGRKAMLKFAGCAGDYYTYPTIRYLHHHPKRCVVLSCGTEYGMYYDISCVAKKEICYRCRGDATRS